MSRTLSAIGLALAVASGLAFFPSDAQAQKGLVYCPAPIDATGCGPIITALSANPSPFPDGVETAYDGSSGTVDLATADLSAYAVLVVPSLADGAGAEPYGLLRNQQIVGRLSSAFNGRNAVWSGTPDHGSTNRAAKDALLRNLAGWARADAGAGRGAGIVVLQDNSDDGASRYGWLRGISGLTVVADTTFEVYSNVQVLTSTGSQLLTNSSGLQIGYSNMASYGLVASGGGSSNDAIGGRTTRVVLVTTAGEAGGASAIATVVTDKEDYLPGDTITVTGAGWEPGETVSLLFHEDVDPPIHPDKTLTAVADADGHILNHQYEVEETDLGVRFTLVATGQTSGRTAQTTFTDGKVNAATIATFTVNAAPPPLCTATAQSAFPAASQVCATATITDLSGNAGQNTDFFIVWLDRNDVVRRATPFTIPGGTTVSATSPFVRSDVLPTQSGGNQGPTGSTWKVKVCSNANCNGTGNTHANANYTFANAAPVAVNDAATTNEDTPFSINVRGNDTDLNGDLLNIVNLTQPAAGTGTVAVNASDSSVTYTPPLNFNGSATFTYRASDGVATSANTATVTVTVNAVNDVPSFTKGANQTVNEDAGAQSVAGWATAISAGPADESGQTLTFEITSNTNAGLFAVAPAVSSTGALTYTSANDANGVATITLRLGDNGGTANGGVDVSATQNFTITVNAVNDAPSFTKGTDQTVLEGTGLHTVTGWATAISAGPANESGQTLTFQITANSNAALFSTQPAVAANGTLTYTLAASGSGVATITLVLKDNGGILNGGVDTSPSQSFLITVEAANAAPVAVDDGPYVVNEDNTLTVSAALGVLLNDTDADGDPLTAILVTGPAAGATTNFTLNPNGSFSFEPAANFNGAVSFTYRANDGTVSSATAATVSITVNAVNDAPIFTKGADETVLEDAGAQTVLNWATAISAGPSDESGQTLAFTLTNDNNPLFAVQPTLSTSGTLTYTPADDAFGAATVTVRLSDNGGTANGGVDHSEQTFTITVTPVNDAPSFTKGADQTVDEDAGAQSVAGWATAISAGPNESSQTVDFIVTNNNSALFSAAPAVAANGTLTYTPAPNANGSATVTIKAHDDGGTANGGINTSAPQTFSITVRAVNDAPTYTKGADPTVLEDAGAQTVTGWATNLSAGPPDESGQTLAFQVTNNTNSALFSSQPSVNVSTGTLTFTPAPDAFGDAIVTLELSDDGGTANGGVDRSSQTFTITVTGVNDAPSFTKGADQTVNEDAGAQSVPGWATAIDAGPNESGQTLTFEVTDNSNTALFASGPAVSSTGALTYTPAPDANGFATIKLRLKDDGGTANGGVDVSAEQTFKITVNPVNDAPTFTAGADPTVLEDAGPQTVSNWATNIKKGPANESGQTLTFTLTPADPSLFAAGPTIDPATGTLTYTTAANAFGPAVITTHLEDNGGTDNGGVNFSEQNFTINITPVNDAPSFTKGADQTVNEDAGAQSVSGWATAISAGPNESSQTVDFIVTNNNGTLFSAAPAVAANGTLTYTTALNANGSATVTIKAHDDGGTANGGIDLSAAQTFTITVNPVNDAPSFTKGSDVTISETASLHTVTGWATSISKGPPDEAGQTLQFIITADATRFITYPAIDPSTGTLTFRAKSTPNTPISISVVLKDNGGTANGGVDASASQTFTITVSNVPPSALAVTLPPGPVPVTNAAVVTTGFTDPGAEDVHTVTVDWGDLTSPTSQILTVGARSNQQSHTYAQPNVYTVTVTVADGDGGSISDTFEYIVIYDPEGGFVTGGGTMYSPAGAYRTKPASEGRANFGFVSKYVKNSSLPIGNTEFQFQAGDLNFKSLSYEWLVVSGTKGQYRGYGMINGAGNYRFVLTVNDGAPDQFRIRIWSDLGSADGNGSIVYDNQLADPTDAFANAKAAIATGSIVVHAPNGKTALK